MPWDKEGKGKRENWYSKGYEHMAQSAYEMRVNVVFETTQMQVFLGRKHPPYWVSLWALGIYFFHTTCPLNTASYFFSFSVQREREIFHGGELIDLVSLWSDERLVSNKAISWERTFWNHFFPTYMLPSILALHRVCFHVRSNPSVCCFSFFFLFLFFGSAPNLYLDIARPSRTQTKWRLNEYWVSPPQPPVNLERFFFFFL